MSLLSSPSLVAQTGALIRVGADACLSVTKAVNRWSSECLEWFRSHSRLLKKSHMLRCAQSPRPNVPSEYACAHRFIARLASEIFLSSLLGRSDCYAMDNTVGCRRYSLYMVRLFAD